MFVALFFISLPDHSLASTATLTTSLSNGLENLKTTEQKVRDYFSDLPVMIEIARCESKFRQFTDSGNVLRGGYGKQMVGVFQFYDTIHRSTAASLGFDINTINGNLAYARHTYNNQGTTPWNSSSDCWGVVDLSSAKTAQSKPLKLETKADLKKQIAQLREILALLEQLKVLQA